MFLTIRFENKADEIYELDSMRVQPFGPTSKECDHLVIWVRDGARKVWKFSEFVNFSIEREGA